MAFTVFFWVAFVVLLMSIFDVAWQRYDYLQNLKMAKHEVEDEQKRAEGDPLIKSRMKSARMQLMKQRMMDALPKADVVITNPTHYAVALRYEHGHMAAPVLVAKGAGVVAKAMRAIAARHGIPVVASPTLARALHAEMRPDQAVPTAHYAAVAKIMIWVINASRARGGATASTATGQGARA